ncbi:MAG: ThuA domain-containing protein [Planctomycetaceae bacterium]|nr:ThuA domain-containing protein [Planctomycetaceae bacterium]
MSVPEAAAVPAEDIQKILAAAPSQAPAKPKRPRKLLAVTSAPMYYHDVIPWGTEALRILGEQTGAYAMTLDNEPSAFEKDNLAAYDAICFNNTCGHLFEDAKLKQNLIDFVAAGKGFVGIHCSAHTFVGWEPYGLLNGAFSVSHPWMTETVTIRIEEPVHPVVSMLGDSIALVDEIYEFAPEPYSRRRLRVLASIDTSRTDMTKPEIKRTDGDFGLIWVQNFGKGRSFFSALGHYKELYWDGRILEHYLAGIQFALGDLEAPAAPR